MLQKNSNFLKNYIEGTIEATICIAAIIFVTIATSNAATFIGNYLRQQGPYKMYCQIFFIERNNEQQLNFKTFY